MATFKESLDKLKSEVVKQQPQIEKEFDAVATHIIDINNFYIVPLSCYRLVHLLEKPGILWNNDITEYSSVIYKSPTLRQNVRGTVHTVHSDRSYNIFAKDYGFIDVSIPYQDLYKPLSTEVENIPGLAQLCGLSMCYPREGLFNEDAINAFRFFMGQKGERLSLTIKEITNNKLGVLVVSSESNPDDVSTSMAYAYYSVFYGKHF